MADKRISELDAFARPVSGAELVPLVQDGATVRAGIADLPAPWAIKKVGVLTSIGNSALALGGLGLTPSQSGTANARNAASTNLFTRARRTGYSVGSGSTAGSWHGFANLFTAGGIYAAIRFGVSQLPTSGTFNLFAGLSSIAGVNADLSASNVGFGVRRESDGWKVISHNGTTRTEHTALSTATYPNNTANVDLYDLALYRPPNGGDASWTFARLNTGDVARGTMPASALPDTNIPLTISISLQASVANSGAAFDVVQMYVETPV